MGNTPNFQFRYPDGGDTISASALQNLAEDVDTELENMEGTNRPTLVTLTALNGWSVVTGDLAGEPVRLYKMGRLVVMMGEIIKYGPTGGALPDGEHVLTIPYGWRPATRVRFGVVRSTNRPQAEIYVNKNGQVLIHNATTFYGTPGYSLTGVWITEAL